MVFLSICTALYDYVPQGDGELPITEGELIYVVEKSTEDDWWKAKKKAAVEDEEEPIGLIPSNYVEEAQPTHQAKALYDYSRQTDEELSFTEDATLLVYDTSDPDWSLVGLNGEFGFAPSNYIEVISEVEVKEPVPAQGPPLPKRDATPAVPQEESPEPSPQPSPGVSHQPQGPAAHLASIMSNKPSIQAAAPRRTVQFTPEVSDEEEPPPPTLPQRPPSLQFSPPPPARQPSPPSPEPSGGVIASPPLNRLSRSLSDAQGLPSPGGYHLYNINEMVSIMGKQKKMPTTLGINLATGVILIIPEKKRDGPQQEWTAEKLTHYSIEGKHVFMELVKPSKSIDFHAGAKDTANEIVSSLGELAGMARAEGLREVISAGSGKGQRKGHMLYDFMAQGDDEVTVADGDEVIVLDDTQSEEWWKVRRIKNGKEGVVPSSYVEITGLTSPPPASTSIAGLNAGRSTVEQNRREEERLAREAVRAEQREQEAKVNERGKRDSRADSKSTAPKSKPDPKKIRTWTDRSGSFKVEAQFIGLKDGKIHLHKLNGVKIAVPVVKMAADDLEYVERVTGISLDEDKPLSDIRKKNQENKGAGASVEQPKKPEYDWFDFFLKCGVSPYQCERYSFNFNKDSMDETVLEDITPAVLRTLGLKEGDVLRVMKFLDTKYGRTGGKSKLRNVSFGGEEVIGNGEDDSVTSPGGGLFSGPGGALKNNTRKGRPAPTVQTNDTVDSKVFQQSNEKNDKAFDTFKDTPESPKAPPPPSKDKSGFDDEAWDVKPNKLATKPWQPAVSATSPSTSAPPVQPTPPALTGSMADLSLLSEPLKPIITHPTDAPPTQSQPPQQVPIQQFPNNLPQQSVPQPAQQQLQQQGANPAFFNQLAPQPTGALQQGTIQGIPQPFISQPTGQLHLNPPSRQRPQAPPLLQQSTLIPPPPRPLSAPQNASSPTNFGPPPLQPQLTGIVNQAGFQNQITSPISQSPNDLNRMRLQQQLGQQQHFQPQFTGLGSPGQQLNQYPNGYQTQPNAFNLQGQMVSQLTGMPQSQFAQNNLLQGGQFANSQLQPQATGFQPNAAGLNQPFFNQNTLIPQPTGINSVLSPPLLPQNTGMNGLNRPGFGQPPPPIPQIPSQFGQAPPIPPIPQQQTLTPLQPQKTGPAPPVRFGVNPDLKKLTPQPTGRKANLSQATPENPFGF